MVSNLKRHSDWQSRLQQYLSVCSDVQFNFGQHDCCLFAANCVLAMTGVDLATEWRGRYDSEDQAFSFGTVASIAKRGLKHLRRRKADELGVRGDIVLLSIRDCKDQRHCLGIVGLAGKPIGAIERGYGTPSNVKIIACWEVPLV